MKCLRCAALPQASLAIYVFIDGEGHQPRAILYSTSLEAVGLAQCNNFGLQLWFFAVSLPTSDCPSRPGTTPITSNTLQGSCRKQKAIYYVKPMRNYEIMIARKIFFKLKDTSEHSVTNW